MVGQACKRKLAVRQTEACLFDNAGQGPHPRLRPAQSPTDQLEVGQWKQKTKGGRKREAEALSPAQESESTAADPSALGATC